MRDRQQQWEGKSVMQSQSLMTVIDPRSGYQATLDLPSQQFAYLRSEQVGESDHSQSAKDNVLLRLRSDPIITLNGKVIRVGQTAYIDKHQQSVLEVTAELSRDENQKLRVGASVVGQLELGKRSLGFVLFRPLIEQVRSLAW